MKIRDPCERSKSWNLDRDESEPDTLPTYVLPSWPWSAAVLWNACEQQDWLTCFIKMSQRNWWSHASRDRDKKPTCLNFSILRLYFSFFFFYFTSEMRYFQVKFTDGHLMWALRTFYHILNSGNVTFSLPHYDHDSEFTIQICSFISSLQRQTGRGDGKTTHIKLAYPLRMKFCLGLGIKSIPLFWSKLWSLAKWLKYE